MENQNQINPHTHRTMGVGIKREIFYVPGMHCQSCEILLEKNIREVAGVKKARADYRKRWVEVWHEDSARGEIESAVKKSGYYLSDTPEKVFFSRKIEDYAELLLMGAILVAIYLATKILGLFSWNIQYSNTPGFTAVVLIGLTAGISTCMALVGGLVLGISAAHNEKHPEATRSQKFRPHLFFNLGRLVSYALLGGIIGLAGGFLKISESITGVLIMLVGVLMIFLGLKLIAIFPGLNYGLALPKKLAELVGTTKETKEYSHKKAAVMGALTFFLPCGFTQAMQVYAISTGSFVSGATIMFLFALGTAPGLMGIGGLISVIKGVWSNYFFKFVGLAVMAMGFWNISNGYTLTGYVIPPLKLDGVPERTANTTVVARIENGKQVVEMEQGSRGYFPNRFTVKKDVPIKWVVNSTNSYTCASNLVIPRLGIRKVLQAGLNTVEFTPGEIGLLKFTCAMGMYSGYFEVVN